MLYDRKGIKTYITKTSCACMYNCVYWNYDIGSRN